MSNKNQHVVWEKRSGKSCPREGNTWEYMESCKENIEEREETPYQMEGKHFDLALVIYARSKHM